jgi:hypothetical protein
MPVPRPRSAMRKIREVLRLSLGDGLSRRQVGAATGLPYTTVADHLARARAAGLSWPLPDGLDDAALEAALFASAVLPPPATRPLPDWAAAHHELRRKGVTLQLLWIEYKERHPDGYQYKEFNVSRERIRQIEAKARRKLRHPTRSRKLRDYLVE